MKDVLYISINDQDSPKQAAVKLLFPDLPAGRYKVEVTSAKKRSLPQNAWFHAVLPDIMEGLRNIGYNEIRTLSETKDFVKSIFFKKSYSNGIDTVEVIEGTSEQTKLDFISKAEDIIIWAQQYLGIDIAPPAEQLSIALAERDEDLNTTIVKHG